MGTRAWRSRQRSEFFIAYGLALKIRDSKVQALLFQIASMQWK